MCKAVKVLRNIISSGSWIFEVRMNFPGVFLWFLSAMRQWLSSELAHVQSREVPS